MSSQLNRRDPMKWSLAGVAVLGAVTSVRAEAPASLEAIVADPKRSYWELLGFGAAFTGAVCQNLPRMLEQTGGV